MLADVVLIIHFAFVIFVLFGAVVIWIGIAFGWDAVRNRMCRIIHLASIGFVALESLFGLACPLTILEDDLRGTQSASGFVARWLHRWMFYAAPDWIFTVTYVGFAALVVLTYWRFPPRPSRSGRGMNDAVRDAAPGPDTRREKP